MTAGFGIPFCINYLADSVNCHNLPARYLVQAKHQISADCCTN